MNPNIVYIVSSFHRSGSSMMMDCLSAGGLTPVYDKVNDEIIANIAPSEYVPNPNGFFQYPKEIDANFYEENKGKLVKVYVGDLNKLPLGKYQVVFMKRNPAEIKASMHSWSPVGWGDAETVLTDYDNVLSDCLQNLKARKIDIIVLNYADVVANPVQELTKLAGWGIDVNLAAARVVPSLYRLKLENL